MDDKKRMIDGKYVENEDIKRVEEQEAARINQAATERINAVNNDVAHSLPNTNLHETPYYFKKGKGLEPLPQEVGLQPGENIAEEQLANAAANRAGVANTAGRTGTGYGSTNNAGNTSAANRRYQQGIDGGNERAKGELRTIGARRSTSAGLGASAAYSGTTDTEGSGIGEAFGKWRNNFVQRLNRKERAHEQEAKGKAEAKRKKYAIGAGVISTAMFMLLIVMSLLLIDTIFENQGIDVSSMLESSSEDLENALDDYDEGEMTNYLENSLSSNFNDFASLSTSNSIYSIKMGKASVLALETEKTEFKPSKSENKNFEFDIKSLNELYPSIKNYDNTNYAYAFYYKIYKLDEYYKNLCGKRVLDLPLLMITLKLESDNMQEVFVSNLGYIDESRLTMSKIDEMFIPYFDYYYDWSSYTITGNSSAHDMEMLAQNMVDVRGRYNCSYDEEKYNEFLKKFIEEKYYINPKTGTEAATGNKSARNFPTYSLTEDQLLQIASLCAQEQGHSNPEGAAAEASLMANKFELSGGEYARKYTNTADALYHYVRGTGKPPKDWWWAKAPTFMDKRDAKPEIVEAVRDVLINGNRTLPKYVVSHDCPNCGSDICPSGKKGDICEVVTNGVKYTSKDDVANRSNYIPHVTKVQNVYGSSYKTFYAFPSSAGDPFSYKDPSLREKVGECHYDYKTKQFVDCVEFSDVFVSWLIGIADDDTHGYSQLTRDSLIDFDCSSLVYYGLLNSGFTTSQLGGTPFTTKIERDLLKKIGFKEIKINGNLNTLKKGDILWKDGHTEVYIGGNMTVGAHRASNEGISDGQYGDQDGKEISVVSIVTGDYWQYAYRYEG